MNVPRTEADVRPPPHDAHDARRGMKIVCVDGGVRRWESAEESRAFARNFSKALVEALVRGDGAVAVWVDGQVHLQTKT